MAHDQQHIQKILGHARSLHPDQLEAYLDEACGDDAALREEIVSLLAHIGSNATVQTEPLDSAKKAPVGEYAAGEIIGSFTIRECVGTGGMGDVYLAEQISPVRRKVALKVIKPGVDTKAALARFQAERQALSMMDHPGIARVLEAGATDTGRPWFAMEYIKGVDLDTFCNQNRLNNRMRLQLFAQVCDAVQHAHQKGVIHRDLKPGNILVTRDEHDQPLAKIIDFGIAKALTTPLTELTLHTSTGQVIGTMAYMSPEQVDGSVDVDTRMDVYSLGVILYELLTGRVPFEQETSYEELKLCIREQDPPRPSTKLTSLKEEEAIRLAKTHRTDLVHLEKELRRELEWIPLKALRKEREERYSSPEALAADVRRYLAGEALEAGPLTRTYRVRKFLRRNRVPVITATGVALFLFVATTFSLILMNDALNWKAHAERNERLALEQLDIAQAKEIEAEQEREAAIEARNQAVKASTETLKQSYFANIHASNAAMQEGDLASAERRLALARENKDSLAPEDMPFEWKYLIAETNEAVLTIHGHDASVQSTVFSDDGKRLASIDAIGTVLTWDSTTGEELGRRTTRTPKDTAKARFNNFLSGTVTWLGRGAGLEEHLSSHGRFFVVVGDGTCYIADQSREDERITLIENEGFEPYGDPTPLAFSPDGKRMAVAFPDGEVLIYHPRSGILIDTISAYDGDPPREDNLTGMGWFKEPPKGHASVAFNRNPDASGQFAQFATAYTVEDQDNPITLFRSWDLKNMEILHEEWIPRELVGVERTVIRPDLGAIALIDVDGEDEGDEHTGIEIRSTRGGSLLHSITGHEDGTTAFAFSPGRNHLVATGGHQGVIHAWDLQRDVFDTFNGHSEQVNTLAFNPSGTQLVSGSSDGTVRTWSTRSMPGHESRNSLTARRTGMNRGNSLAFSPDGRLVAVAGRGRMTGSTDLLVPTELDLEERSAELTMYRRNRYVSQVNIINLDTFETLAELEGEEGHFGPVAFSPDGTRFAAAFNSPVPWSTANANTGMRIWDAHTGEVIKVISYPEKKITYAVFSLDGTHLAIADSNGTCSLLDANTGATVAAFRTHEAPKERVRGLALSQGGERLGILVQLSSASDPLVEIRVWDFKKDMFLSALQVHSIVTAGAWSPDGNTIAFANYDGSCYLWNVGTAEASFVMKGHRGPIISLIFNEDGSRLITGGADSTIRIWDMQSGEHLITLKAAEGSEVYQVALSPDEDRIASYARGEGPGLRFWHTKSLSMLADKAGLTTQYQRALDPLVARWMEQAEDDDLVMAMLDRECSTREEGEGAALRNLVLRELVKRRQAREDDTATATP